MKNRLQAFLNFLKSPLVILMLVFGLSLFLRLININKGGGLWDDEMISFYEAKQSFPFGILNMLYQGNSHVPLYFFLLHFWIKFFGQSDTILRLLSVLFGTLTVLACYLVGKELSSRKTGI